MKRAAWARNVCPRCALAIVLMLCGLNAPSASAQHADIEFETSGGQITLPAGNLFSAFLFGTGFPPAQTPPPTQTDNPGFFAPDGAFAPAATIGLRVVQPLHYWNGGIVTNPAPLNTIFRLQTNGGATIDVTRAGVPANNSFNFATTAAEGGVHQHLLFRLPEATAPSGAYGVVLQLTSPGLDPSPPLVVVFSQQISAAQLATARQDIFRASGIGDGAFQADFDLDEQVDGDDLGLWKAGAGTNSHALLSQGDADRDGDADGADFLQWQRQVGSGLQSQVHAEVASVAVPEPGAIALLMIACLASGVARQRRRWRPRPSGPSPALLA